MDTVQSAIRYLTPEMGGAIGDGNPAHAAADMAGWAWLEANMNDGDVVQCYGRYCFNDEVVMTKTGTFDGAARGAIINCRVVPGVALRFTGTVIGAPTSLSGNAQKGGTLLPVAGAGNFVEGGHIVRVSSNVLLADSRPALIYEREWVRVRSVENDAIHLCDALEHGYAVADDAKIVVAAPIKALHLKGLNIINDDQIGQIGILIEYFEHLRAENITTRGGEKGLYCRFGVAAMITDPRGYDVNKGLGYAFQCQSVRYPSIWRPDGNNCRHITEISENSLYTAVHEPPSGIDGMAGTVSWHPGPLHNRLVGGSTTSDVYMRGSANSCENVTFAPGSTLYIGEVEANAPAKKMTACANGEIKGCTFLGAGGSLGKVVLRHPPRNFSLHHNVVDIGSTIFVNVGEVGFGINVEFNDFKTCGIVLLLRRADWSHSNVAPFGDANFAGITVRWNKGQATDLIATPIGKGNLLNYGLFCDGMEIRGNEMTLSGSPWDSNRLSISVKNLRFIGNSFAGPP